MRRRIQRKCRFALLFLILGGVTFAGLAASLNARQVRVRRYVSPPLPDGTRYTFLYPLWDRWPYTFASPQGIDVEGSCPRDEAGWLIETWDTFFHDRDYPNYPEGLSVQVLPPDMVTENKRYETAGIRNASLFHHSVTIKDARSRRRFILTHSSFPWYREEYFDRSDPTVIQSFRVLVPGEPVPVP
jgi:hypothetical protein